MTDLVNDGITHRMYSESFLAVVSHCIQVANAVRADHGIDILETDGSSEITDDVIRRLDCLSSIYLQSNHQHQRDNGTRVQSFQQHDACPQRVSFDHLARSVNNNYNQQVRETPTPEDMHHVSITLPPRVEMQLRNNRLLRETISNYRRHQRFTPSLKLTKVSSRRPADNDEELLIIEAEPLCPTDSESSSENPSSSSISARDQKESLPTLMKQIDRQCKSKAHQQEDRLLNDIKAIVHNIIVEETAYQYLHEETKVDNQVKSLVRTKKRRHPIIDILPYENTYGRFYYPNEIRSVEPAMIEKIIHGVQAMAATLTSRKDAEDILNGIVAATDRSLSTPVTGYANDRIADELIESLEKRFITRKQGYTTTHERRRTCAALDLIIADQRLNGVSAICRPDSLVLSCILRKILKCTQGRTLCSYADVLTTLSESDPHQIRFRTIDRMSLSSDEFIEIIGEMYHTGYETVDTMKYYLEATDIIDMETNLIHASVSSSQQIDEMMKYILREDAIRLLLQLILDRQRNQLHDINERHRQFKLVLPTKLNDLFQPIRKLNAFMSTAQVLTAIRRSYLSQLTQRSKSKPVTLNDLRAITSQIWLLREDFDTLVTEETITPTVLCQFYTGVHEKEDIDERLTKVVQKIHDHLNSNSCITRVVFKMVAEQSDGTSLTPFLDGFRRTPRLISILDIGDDLLASSLISIGELLVFSKQEIIIKKSTLLKHFQRLSFIRKHDADLLAEVTLVMREDLLIGYLTERAAAMRQAYISCILSNDERRQFIDNNISRSTKRLSSLSIHEFIRRFNLDPSCGKIFYWMNLTDESVVKTLIETKAFVNEYTLDGVYHSFLTRFRDTLESGIYHIPAEDVLHSDRPNEWFTVRQLGDHRAKHTIDDDKLCKLGCFLTYQQASILVGFADPQYELRLPSLVVIRDTISQESLRSSLQSHHGELNSIDLSQLILPKQQVIPCKTLLESFRQRISERQKRFERVRNVQTLLLSPALFDRFIEVIPELGDEYFTRTELDYLEETKLVDLGVHALLLSLPSYNPLAHQHKYAWFRDADQRFATSPSSALNTVNYLHVLDPVIEKYSVFLTIILLRILSGEERFPTVNEILLPSPASYLSTEEVLKICAEEQLLSADDISRICRETFPASQTSTTNESSADQQKLPSSASSEHAEHRHRRKSSTIHSDSEAINSSNEEISRLATPECYARNIAAYADNSRLQEKLDKTMVLAIFDYILHFNHRAAINGRLRQLFDTFKPQAIYKAQLLIEKEMTIVKLLLKTRRREQGDLKIDDLNRYLESYPIPCRLDMINELRRSKIVAQSLANEYTMGQCHQLKAATPEAQTNFLFYMVIRLIREDGYIDEMDLKKILREYGQNANREKFDRIRKHVLRNGFLTVEQLIRSAKDFFLQDYFNETTLSDDYKTVIQEPILTDILLRTHQTPAQLEITLVQHMRRRPVVQIYSLADQLKQAKVAKEKVQRKVDNVLSKMDGNTYSSKLAHLGARATLGSLVQHRLSNANERLSSTTSENTSPESAPDLRSLRHHYIEAKIPRNQLHLLAEQGGWSNDVYLEFKRELDIIDSDNSLDLIRHIIKNISALIKENGSVAEEPLTRHYRQHRILFLADFRLLLARHGMVALEDLTDLLVVSRLTKAEEIESYARKVFSLNVNTFLEISRSHEDILVRSDHVQNNLEKRSCLTAANLSQLLNHVLKLDRLKRILDIMPSIKNYLHLHPISTFNALKAFKLEFDFNHSDIKFLRDLKLLSDLWYKRYLLARTSETNTSIPAAADEEQDQDDRHEFRFRSSANEDLGLDTLHDLSDGKDSYSSMSEQRKQSYLEQLRKRKEQLHAYRSKLSTGEEELQLSLNLDEKIPTVKARRDGPRVIEEFFPNASTADSPLLVPFLSDDQTRLFMQLDFATEQNIEEDLQYQQTDVEQQRDSIETVKQESVVPSVKSGEQAIVNETGRVISTVLKDKGAEREQLGERQRSAEDTSLEMPKSTSPTTIRQIGEETIETTTASIAANIAHEYQVDEPLSSVLLNTINDLSVPDIELFHEMAEAERVLTQKDLQLVRHIVDQWLQRTVQHNERLYSIDTLEQSATASELYTNELIHYLRHELVLFDKTLISSTLFHSPTDSKVLDLLRQRTSRIERTLRAMENHQQLLSEVRRRIVDTDQMIASTASKPHREEMLQELNLKFAQYQENVHQIEKQADLQVQSLLGTRLELAIRTLNVDLQLIEQRLTGKPVDDVFPPTSLIAARKAREPIRSIVSDTYEALISTREKISALVEDVRSCEIVPNARYEWQDLLTTETVDRLRAIQAEYSKQKANEEKLHRIGKSLDEFDEQRWQEIHHQLDTLSDQIQRNLLAVTTARDRSNHPAFSLHTTLKYLPVDQSGNPMTQQFCLVDDHDMPISNPIHLIRLPTESDRFQLSDDQSQLTIVDENQTPLCDPISFGNLTSESITFAYTNDDRRTVELSAPSLVNERVALNVKPVPFDQSSALEQPTNQALFVMDNGSRLLSKSIQLIKRNIDSPNLSELNLSTFLVDEQRNEKVLLTHDQYLITLRQAEFTSRKFLTFLTNKDNHPVSEPIQLSDFAVQMRNVLEESISKRLALLDKERRQLFDHLDSTDSKHQLAQLLSDEYEFILTYIQDRLDKLRIEENIIEQIVPILDERYNTISADQVEYQREQSNMDHLLHALNSIVQLDEILTTLRRTNTTQLSEVEKVERQLIHQLTDICNHLNDPLMAAQVRKLSSRFHDTQLLAELQPMVLSGIKTRAKAIQKKCDTLLMNIQKKTNQSRQPEQIRSEYIEYLADRWNEERERAKDIGRTYDRIERMQYDLHQKIDDSAETIELADLDDALKDKYNIDQPEIPPYLQTKNDKLVYKCNHTLRSLHHELKRIEQSKTDLLNELRRFLNASTDHEISYLYRINFVQNENELDHRQELLQSIEKLKVLLNKLETVDEKNAQHGFLLSKLDRLYEVFRKNHQIKLPATTHIESIRASLNTVRKTTQKEMHELDDTRNELLRNLDVLKKKEELKQRTKASDVTEVSAQISSEFQLSSLTAYVQQSIVEPISPRHEFYAMKIQQLADQLVSILGRQSLEQRTSIMPSLSRAVDDLKSYRERLDQWQNANENELKGIREQISIAREYSIVDSLVREQIEDLINQQNMLTRYQQMIIHMQLTIKETLDRLQALLILDDRQTKTQQRFKELKQHAVNALIQATEYEHLSKHVSPHLLALHGLTAGQERIPSTVPSLGKRFQLAMETHVDQEHSSESFLLQRQSYVTLQKNYTEHLASMDSADRRTQLLRSELTYLQEQYDKAATIGDISEQLATRQAMAARVKIDEFDREHQTPSKASSRESPERSTAVMQSVVEDDRTSTLSMLPSIDQQIHELLTNQVELLQRRIHSNATQPDERLPSVSEDEDQVSSNREMFHSIGDLRQLDDDLRKVRNENDRPQQINVQLKILDRIDQLDRDSATVAVVQSLRQDLQREQHTASIRSVDGPTHHYVPAQVLPTFSHAVTRSPYSAPSQGPTSTTVAEQTMIPMIGSVATTSAKELYQELQELRFSIGRAFESNPITSTFTNIKQPPAIPPAKNGVVIERDEKPVPADDIHIVRIPSQSRLQSNSVEEIHSSVPTAATIHEATTVSSSKTMDIATFDNRQRSSSLSIVGNVRKYSLTEKKASTRRIIGSAQRSMVQSQREYGDVYVRHRLPDGISSASNLDEDSKQTGKSLHDKVKRQTRLVKFEKTIQGNTVIHRQVNVPIQLSLLPRQADYEENLQPAPPLIEVADIAKTDQFQRPSTTFSLTAELERQRPSADPIQMDAQSDKSEPRTPIQSSTRLSPIEEESEEVEPTYGIVFPLVRRDLPTKKSSIDATNQVLQSDTLLAEEKLTPPLNTSPSTLAPTSIPSAQTLPSVEEKQHPPSEETNQVDTITTPPPSPLKRTLPALDTAKPKSPAKSPVSKKQKASKKRSPKGRSKPTSVEQPDANQQLVTMTLDNDDSLSTQPFEIEPEVPEPAVIIPEGKVVYHKVGVRAKRGKKKKKSKKTQQKTTSGDRTKSKRHPVEPISNTEPLVVVPRKAVPFISATEGKQINVEDEPPIKSRKRKRKRSSKKARKRTRSRSSSKRRTNVTEKFVGATTELKPATNKDAIAMHLLNTKRFTGPPVTAISVVRTAHQFDDVIELSDNALQRSRLKLLKPMTKNFELDANAHRYTKEVHTVDVYDLDKELFDFHNDTKDINQPALFTEYIPEFFQKQAGEKQIRRISLTAIKTDEQLIKRLAPRVSRLYHGWQPSDTPCAHTDEFRPLKKYLMSNISYYFDDDFIDESGLFQTQKNLDKTQPRIKQPTQRFRDEYIVKEFFHCWKDSTTEKARLAELRRKRVMIDFREFWFQDAFADPLFSYFERPSDYAKKQDHHHQLAYRQHKRLVRTGREQPKETMNGVNRPAFLPLLFNLPNHSLDRQVSLTRRRQSINIPNDERPTDRIPLSHLLTHRDELLALIRERVHFLNRATTPINLHRDELAIRHLLVNSPSLRQGTLNDLDQVITDYYASLAKQVTKASSTTSSSIVKLPLLKQASRRTLTVVD